MPTDVVIRGCRGRCALSTALGGSVLFAAALAAQAVPERALTRPSATIAGEFAKITSVRELADRRVVVADRRTRQLLLADFTSGTAVQIGRAGNGPGEYRSIGWVVALSHDSSLVEDRQLRRWLIMHGDRVARTLSVAATTNRFGPMLAGADTLGRILEVQPFRLGRQPNGAPGPAFATYAESLLVLLRWRGAGRADTVARIGGRFRGMWRTNKDIGNGTIVPWVVGNALAVEDQALLFPDGWVALVYRDPYRVEWRRPEGAVHRIARLTADAIPVTEAEKRAAIKREYPNGPGFSPDEMPNWPRLLPAIENDALLAAPGGMLLIARMPRAGVPARYYDVVDRNGVLRERIRIGLNQRIVGASERAVYVSAVLADDEVVLQRYSW